MGVVTVTVLLQNPTTGAVTVLAPGDEVPEWAEGLVGDHALAGPGDGPVPESSGGGYSDMKVDDLRAEVEARNEGRDEADLIPSDGKKADLVAALTADDDN